MTPTTVKDVVLGLKELFVGHPERHTQYQLVQMQSDGWRYCIMGGMGQVVEGSMSNDWNYCQSAYRPLYGETFEVLRQSIADSDLKRMILRGIASGDLDITCTVNEMRNDDEAETLVVNVNDDLGFEAIERMLVNAAERVTTQ